MQWQKRLAEHERRYFADRDRLPEKRKRLNPSLDPSQSPTRDTAARNVGEASIAAANPPTARK